MKQKVKSSIADATKQTLESYPFLDEFFQDECVNFSALATKIIPQIEKTLDKKNIKKEAVIMSIIRYSKVLKTEKIPSKVKKTVANSTLTLKTDIAYANIPRTIQNLKVLESVYSKIKWDKGEVFFTVQGVGEISVVMDKSNFNLLKKIPKEEIELQFPKTALVILHSNEEATVPGFIHFVTKPVAKAGISIELLTLKRDTIFLVDEKNAIRLFDLLKNLVDGCKK